MSHHAAVGGADVAPPAVGGSKRLNLRFIAVAALIALSAFALGVLVAINVASPA